MSDGPELDESNFLDPEWNRAWYQLRNAGWPDFAIWDMVASVDDAGWPDYLDVLISGKSNVTSLREDRG